MNKIISLLLALMMLLSLGVTAFAETEKYEIFERFQFGGYGSDARVETEHFILESSWHSYDDVEGGGNNAFVRIKAKKGSGLIIKRIEANVSCYASRYSQVGVTAGVKRETGNISNDSIVYVDSINKSEFEFAGGSNYVCFDMIKVYYEKANATGSTISTGNVWIIAGVAAVAVVAFAAVVIAKKKKKA